LRSTAAWEKWKECGTSWNALPLTLWQPNELQVMGFISLMGDFAGSKHGGALAYSTVAYMRKVWARLEKHWNRKLPL